GLEVNPVSKNVEWVFDAGKDFYSHAAGALQRLPNGNTLISEDIPGRVFEVTPAGEVVWQYQSDMRTCRAKRFDYNYCPQLAQFNK
ncbi:MAG: hypothetical protein KDD62_02015, partial [Bdellovibrionales bacterium]|nr:hypothetical protein [Bdellovibrionales bacterium]